MPVGSEYRWYILAHQNVAKLTANDYTTSLTGLKFKIAHKRADSGKWSATPRTQRKRMINFLRSVLADLEKESERESGALPVRQMAEAPKERKARVPHARRATSRVRRTTRAAAGRPARRARS